MEAMMTVHTSTLSADPKLDQLARQFEHWRQNRSHPSERLPQDLWAQAAALAAVIPYSRVAKHLRLSPSDLKKQTVPQPDLTRRTPAPPWSFLAVPPVSEHPMEGPETEVELERADGARLRLRSGHTTLSLAALVRAFLEAH
jgi:hypothetical protein